MRLYLDSCVLIYALDGAVELRRHTLEQLERLADADWLISDLVPMEGLVGPLRSADQPRPPLELIQPQAIATASP